MCCSDRTFVSTSGRLVLPNTGVNTPSFIAFLRTAPLRPQRPIAFADLATARFHGEGLDRRPHAAAAMALEHRVDDARRMIAVLEGRKRRRTLAGHAAAAGDKAVDVAHHVTERVGPAFLVPAREMRVARRLGDEQRWILG